MDEVISPSNWKEESGHNAPKWVCINKYNPSHQEESVFSAKKTCIEAIQAHEKKFASKRKNR